MISPFPLTVTGRISRPCREVYEAVADPAILSEYFTTGGAQGRLEPGAEVTWDFHDFPGRFPIQVLSANSPTDITIQWETEAIDQVSNLNSVTFKFESLDDDQRTLVTITEGLWPGSDAGIKGALGNCEGWTGMLAAMKVWLEHGINLREGFYK